MKQMPVGEIGAEMGVTGRKHIEKNFNEKVVLSAYAEELRKLTVYGRGG